jgi:hypothetical protein
MALILSIRIGTEGYNPIEFIRSTKASPGTVERSRVPGESLSKRPSRAPAQVGRSSALSRGFPRGPAWQRNTPQILARMTTSRPTKSVAHFLSYDANGRVHRTIDLWG